MRKLFIAFLFACGTKSVAQEVVVKSFDYLQTDLTARTQEKLDANGNSCAVVKVDIPLEDVVFKGWVVETISTPGEYLVYMPEGATKITMQHKTLTPFTYEFEKPLTGKNTYRLVALIIRADSSKPVYKVIEVSEEIKDSYNKGVSMLAQNKNDEAIKLVQDAANAGYAPAQFKYGQIISDKESVTWYQKAASQGYADAICALGDVYMQGKAVSRNAERALKYYIEAIDLNSSKAMIHAGECYENGEGTPQDMGKAFWYYKKSVELGEISAYGKVAHCYWEGIGIKENKEEAIKWYMEGSEKGDTVSCFKLGKCYDYGLNSGLKLDNNKAYEMYRKAAEKGMARAQVEVAQYYKRLSGEMYYKRNQRMSDEYFEESLKWYQKAADQGNEEGLSFLQYYKEFKSTLNDAKKGDPKAQYDMGIMYLSGEGYLIKPDIHKGIEWLKKSGNQKYLEALIKLGDIYYDYFELNTPYCSYYDKDDRLKQSPNHQEAAKYYQKAAELGNFHSQARLAEMYDNGRYGLKEDNKEAEKWYIKAANHELDLSYDQFLEKELGRIIPTKASISHIQYELGMLYNELKNEKESLKWIQKAAANGSESAKRWLDFNRK